jgi:hypothetical protein
MRAQHLVQRLESLAEYGLLVEHLACPLEVPLHQRQRASDGDVALRAGTAEASCFGPGATPALARGGA